LNTSVFPAERSPRLVPPEETVLPLRRSYFSELIETVFLHDHDLHCRPIMFTSPDPETGVSFICSYVATELASLGRKVLLLDAQSLASLARRPTQDAVKHVEQIDLSHLWVLGPRQLSVRLPEDRGPASSLTSVMATLREEFTNILVDAPALSVSDDAIKLATIVYGTVFVAQAGRTEKQEIVKASREFVSLGGRVLGSIYNAKLDQLDRGTSE
jgi:tyrosine-protein kinase Etk/Wzc